MSGLADLILLLLVLWTAIVLVFCAAMLRTACWLCRVKEPSFGRAMRLSLGVGLAQILVSLPMVLLAETVAPPGKGELPYFALLTSIVVCVLVAAVLYVPLLETSLGKGILIALPQVLLILFLVGPCSSSAW
jgi:hypothetical protein